MAGISKEHHVRRQGGRHVAYIVTDKYGLAPVLLGQKLSAIAEAINSLVDGDPVQKVSAPGLYHKMHRTNDRSGEYLRNRWRIQPYTLEEAADAFNKERGVNTNAAVVGPKECYNTVCV